MVDRRNDPEPVDGADGGDVSVAALAGLLAVDPEGLSDDELASSTIDLARLAQRCQAAVGRQLEVLERRAVHRRDGAVTAPAWLAARTQVSKAGCRSLLSVARDLRGCPLVASAYRSGVLGTAVVESMVKAREGLEGRFARDEQVLVDAISTLTVDAARRVIGRWRQLALTETDRSMDDPHPDDPTLNSLGINATFDGTVVVDGEFSPIVGSELAGLVEAEVTRLFHAGVFSADDGLSPRQRNAQALLGLVRRGSVVTTEAGEPKRAAAILVDLRHLLGIRAETPEELIGWPCELADGTIVPLGQLLAAMDDATITLVLGMFGMTDGRFHPVGEITGHRRPNPHQRGMLRVRDQGCVWPGCDRPARWSHAHHEPEWDHTHRTTLTELVLLCPAHHTMRHRDGYQFLLEPDGTLTVLRPDGTPLPTAPPGHLIQAPSRPSEPVAMDPPRDQTASRRRAPLDRPAKRFGPTFSPPPTAVNSNRTRRPQRPRDPANDGADPDRPQP